MADNNLNEEVIRLRSQIAAMEQLLEVHTMTVLEQSDRLERAVELQSKRATELQTVAQVSAVAASLLETSELLQTVVDLTKSSFELYHTHIYLLDESATNLELATGAGEVGQRMVSEGWQIALDAEQSLVAQAARDRQGVIVNDVHETPGFMANPLLPETASEMAVPLIVGENVLGALDVQSAEINHFSEEDVSIMTTLASQVAVALQNARQFQQTQSALDDLTRLQRAMSREGWQAFMTATERPLDGFFAGKGSVHPITSNEKPVSSDDGKESKTSVMTVAEIKSDETTVTAPMNIRGVTIGGLGVRVPPGHKISAEDQEMLTSISEQVALALETARLSEQTQTALARTDELYGISQAMNESDSEAEILEALTRPAVANGAISSNLMYLDLDEKGNPIWAEFVATYRLEGETPSPIGTRFYLPEMPFSKLWLANADEPLLVSDIRTDERIDDNSRVAIEQGGNRAIAIVPLTRAGERIGLIVYDWDQPHNFGQDETEIYRAIIDLASPAVQSRRLFEQTELSAKREQALRQITAAVRGSTDPTTIMRTAVRELGIALGRRAVIRMAISDQSDGEDQIPDQDGSSENADGGMNL